MAASEAILSSESVYDNFCSMVVEEFLQRKGLQSTLSTFRAEWERPIEVQKQNKNYL
jgi:hypothetical protein